MVEPSSAHVGGDPRWHRRYRLVLAVTLLDGLSLGAVLPMLPFLLLHFGAQPVLIAQLVALYALVSFLANPIMGRLSDRFGRARLVTISFLGTAISFGGMLLTWSLVGVFFFRLLGGLLSGRGSVLRAQLTDGLSPEAHVKPIAALLTASSIGIVGGPVAAAILGGVFPTPAVQFKAVLVLACSCSAFASIAYLMAFPGRRPVPPERANRLGAMETMGLAWKLRLPLCLTITTAVAQGVVYSTSALLAHQRFGWGVSETGALFGVLALVAVLNRAVLIQPLVQRLGLGGAFAAACAVTVPALWAVAASRDGVSFAVAMTVFGLGYSFANVLPVAMVSRSAALGARGLSLGLQQGVSSGALAVAASAAGVLFQFVGSGVPHLVASGVLVLAIALVGIRAALASGGRSGAAPSDLTS